MIRQQKTIKRGGWIWSIIFFLGIIGYHSKPQAVIVLIAIVIVSVTSNKRKPIKQLFIVLAFCLLGVFAGEGVHKLAYHEFDKRISLNEEKAFSYYHWIMMGLNDAMNGGYNVERQILITTNSTLSYPQNWKRQQDRIPVSRFCYL